MDRILKKLVENYAKEFDEKDQPKSDIFESFSAYSILDNQAGIDVNPQDHLLSGGNDIGIDSATIIINGRNVTGKDEVDSIAEISPEMRIGFVFIQSTTSESVSGSKLRNFGDGVKSIFEEKSRFKENKDVEDFRQLTDYVLRKYAIEATERPYCKLFYTYSGSYKEDENIEGKKDLIIEDLEDLNLLSQISVDIVDSSHLQKLYNKANRGVEEEVYFPKKCINTQFSKRF